MFAGLAINCLAIEIVDEFIMPIKVNDHLTKRELECLAGLASGMSFAGIATWLKISVPTVALHLSNARRRLGAHTREQAVAIAVKRNLVTVNVPDSKRVI